MLSTSSRSAPRDPVPRELSTAPLAVCVAMLLAQPAIGQAPSSAPARNSDSHLLEFNQIIKFDVDSGRLSPYLVHEVKNGTAQVHTTFSNKATVFVQDSAGYLWLTSDPAAPETVNATIDFSSGAVNLVHCRPDKKEVVLNQSAVGTFGKSIKVDIYSHYDDGAGRCGYTLDETFTVESFSDLCERHPAHFAYFIKPLFEKLEIDSSFVTSDAEIASVFYRDFVPSEKLIGAFRECVPKLDSDNFRECALAEARLDSLGYQGRLYAREYRASGLSPNQQAYLDVLSHKSILSKDVADIRRNDRIYLLDCLETNDSALRHLVLKRLSQLSTNADGIGLTEDASEAEISIYRERFFRDLFEMSAR